MKKCFKCGKIKSLDEFYKHPEMGDGHLGKCIECTKKDVKNRSDRLYLSQEYAERERKRGREKYYRLGYKGNHGHKLYSVTVAHRKRFPEKYAAVTRCSKMKAPSGMQKHHWSYREEHHKDVFFLSTKDHARLHRYMVYDQERMMYRTKEGILLDTKERHEDYLEWTQTQE
jgi:hypothetical protein